MFDENRFAQGFNDELKKIAQESAAEEKKEEQEEKKKDEEKKPAIPAKASTEVEEED